MVAQRICSGVPRLLAEQMHMPERVVLIIFSITQPPCIPDEMTMTS